VLARRDTMEQSRFEPQLVQPDPHQLQGVRVEDVEAAASIHQHLGEPRVADDWVDDQRVLSWIGDAVRVILTAFSVARTSCCSHLRWC
jgi:IS5 family transposase